MVPFLYPLKEPFLRTPILIIKASPQTLGTLPSSPGLQALHIGQRAEASTGRGQQGVEGLRA